MRLGYYFADSKYGRFYDDVVNYAPIWRGSVKDFQTSEMSDLDAVRKFKEAVRGASDYMNSRFVLALDYGLWSPDEVTEAIEYMVAADVWRRVIAIEVDDEPNWTKPEGAAIYEHVEDALRQMKLEKPVYGIGVVQNTFGIEMTEGWKPFDWIGLEGYVEPPGSYDPKVNRVRLVEKMTREYTMLGGKPFVWVLQGYDRGFAWKDKDTLAALQSDSFSLMRTKPFRDTILPFTLAFSYGRPGGTRDHPAIRECHRSWVFGTRTRTEDPE